MMRITIETAQIADVPLLIIAPEGAAHCPVVFHIHGLTGTKADGVEFGYRLASAGIICVCLDAAMHGDRRDECLAGVFDPSYPHIYPIDSKLDGYLLQYQIAVETAEDISRLLDAFATDTRFDSGQVGILGISMGGLVTYYLAAHESRVQVAVPAITIPNFARYWDDAVLESSANPAWAGVMQEAGEPLAAHTAFVHRIDPMEHLSTFAPKPLLILLGANDTFAYKFGPVDLYRQMLPHYRDHPERLQLRISANTGHEVTREMVGETCAWFAQHLH